MAWMLPEQPSGIWAMVPPAYSARLPLPPASSVNPPATRSSTHRLRIGILECELATVVAGRSKNSQILTILSASDIGHGGRHQRDELNVGGERQAGHIDDGIGDVAYIHARFHHLRAVRLGYAGSHAFGHFRGGIADVDLAAGNIVGAAVEGNGFCESGDGVFGGSVRRGVRSRYVGRDRSVINDAAAARGLLFHKTHGGLRAQERSG